MITDTGSDNLALIKAALITQAPRGGSTV